MLRHYLDFEVRIEPLANGGYPVSVRGPGGDARGTLVLPADSPIYQGALARLARLDTDEECLIQLGQLLFNALFSIALKDVYTRSQGMLKEGQRLRFVFDIDAREAAVGAVPWEFLADPDQGPLAMLDAPIVRYLPTQAAVPTLAAPLPLKVLLTGADTPPRVQIERELGEVQAALEGLGQQVSIVVEPHLTRSILQRRQRQGFHVWHFVGHGSASTDGTMSVLQFEDGTGNAERVSARELNILLKGSGVRLVMLNACQSAVLGIDPLRSVAPALIRADVPAVVAMQLSVTDAGARAFAGEFYQALAEGFPIDACVTEGRRAVMGATGLGRADWGVPVVYTRAADGRLFAPPATADAAQQPVDAGLLALRTLMKTPEIYAAVAGGRDQFDDLLHQIGVLSQYKALHDVLQQLDDCMEMIDGERQRLPQDLRAWGRLAESEPELHAILGEALRLVERSPTDASWARKLERARDEARAGVEQGALELLSRAINRIADVLGAIPWRVNAQLVALAQVLPLPALVRNLAKVAEQMAALALDEWAASQRAVFVRGVAALEAIDRRLGQLVRRHDLFQHLDNELRPVESWIEADAIGLAQLWPDIQPLHAQVCDDLTAAWAPRLVATATELERSLAEAGGQRTAMIFWRYRGQVSQSFNTVDADLLKLCDELQGVGRSLEFVLRTAP